MGVDFPNLLPRLIMQPMPKLDREAFVAQMRTEMEAMLAKVADAINNAPDGHIIAASERPVFDLFAEMRHKAYEAGIQMRTDAAEAAFSPSAGRRDETQPSQ